jgi:4-hydroxy-3-methylbut-2-enyl diphosphate reductase
MGGESTVLPAGPQAALRAQTDLAARLGKSAPVAFAGMAAALSTELRTGDLVVASELRATFPPLSRSLPGASIVAAELRRAGLVVRTGPVVAAPRYTDDGERAVFAASGAFALAPQSASVMGLFDPNPVALVCVISEPAGHDGGAARRWASDARLGSATGSSTRSDAAEALGEASLLALRGPLERWARAWGPRDVLLASPRSFCAGVERAIETVERALERYGPPVYVRRQIVHNLHVVKSLEAKGARFVQELDDVPAGAVVVLAAHGVSPEVRRQAADRGDLEVIDATCPLVAKVHSEARRYASHGHEIVLIGHADHEEVVGTLGEAPDRFHLVESPDDVAGLDLEPDGPVAYLTQTTLATDETAEIVTALRRRFPQIAAPPADDICYATQNRQDAVRQLARACDLVLVVGSANSSNTARLVEVATREGCQAELIEDASQLQLSWLAGARTVGLTAGASAPDFLVHDVVDTLEMLGPMQLRELRTTEETVRFALPIQVRPCQSRSGKTSASLLTSSNSG